MVHQPNYSTVIIKFPLSMSVLQKTADSFCDISMGLSLEEIVQDSIAVYIGNYTLEDWLYHAEVNVWYDHVPSDYYLVVKTFCEEIMMFLVSKYQEFNLPKFDIAKVLDIEVDFKPLHIEFKIDYKER